MSTPAPSVQDYIEGLQNDRLIDITIGDSTTPPIHIQQTVLESASPWFAKALALDTFSEGKSGSIHFPDDDSEAWDILLC